MKSAIFQVRIQFDDENDSINPVHLCEEIQAYLNSWHSQSDNDDYQDARVVSYKFDYDKFTQFTYQED